VRTELLAATKKDIDALLAKYSLASFKEHTANFWRELRRAQPPTKLEKVMQDIDDGKIKWDETDAEEDEDEAPLISASREAAAPSIVPSRDSARASVPDASSSRPAVVAGPKVASPAKDAVQAKKNGLVLTAWELRESLTKSDDDDGEDEHGLSEWLSIHSQTHPDVKAFLDQRNKRKKEEQGKGKSAERRLQQVLPAKRESARATQAKASAPSDRDAAEAGDEYEGFDSYDEDDDEVVTSVPKRRRVEPVKGAVGGADGGAGGKARGGRGADAAGGSTSAHTQNLADTVADTEEDDDEEPVRHQGGTSADFNALNPKDKVSIHSCMYIGGLMVDTQN
jgi:hypothetical protein